jgi:hypothetical protein
VTDSNAWAAADTYLVRAQARDRAGLESDWSEPLSVVIKGGWARTFGGADVDIGRSVQQTSDGGYIVVGFAYSNLNGDVYLVKTDADGNQEWARTFGGSESDEGHSIRQTSDGGYIVLGASGSYRADFWLVKTDADGNQVWTKGFGETGVGLGRSVQQTSDGGYILVGTTELDPADSGDIRLIKTDASGNQTWAQTFGGLGHQDGHSVQQTGDGGYILVGETDSCEGAESDVYLIKTDADGNQTWARTFGAEGCDYGYSVRQTSDGGYIVGGHSQNSGGTNSGRDVYLIKTDASGNQVWAATFGGTNWDGGRSVQQTSDGGYIVAGYCGDGDSGDVYIIKTDASGNKTWAKSLGGTGYDDCHSVQETADGGYVLCGRTSSYGAGRDDVWLIKTDASGNVE